MYYGDSDTASTPSSCGSSSTPYQLGQLDEVERPGVANLTYVYDAAGRLTGLTQGTGTSTGQTVYCHDALGRLTSETTPDDSGGSSSPVVVNAASYSGSSSMSSATWSDTVSPGSDRYLYAAVTTNSSSADSVTGVTYDGSAMTLLEDKLDSTSAGKNRDLSIWGLVAPVVGTANVVASLDASLSAVSGVSVNLVNVNQTSPTGTIKEDDGGSAGAQSLSTTTAGNTSDLNLSALGWRDDLALATPGSGQTQLDYGEGGSGSAFAVTQVSSQPGGSVTDSWSWTDPADASVELTVPIQTADALTGPVAVNQASYSGSSSMSSATWSDTVSPGTDRYLYVAVTTNSSTADSVTGVTYGGTSMTLLEDKLDSTSAGKNRDLSIWGLVAPAVGTANVVASLDASLSAVSGVSVNLVNVNQTSPTGTIKEDDGGSAGAQSLSTTTAGNTNDLNLSALGWRDDLALATPGSGQTQLDYSEGGSGSAFAVTQVSSQPGGSVTDSWSWTDPADASVELTVPIQTASSAGGGMTFTYDANGNVLTATNAAGTDTFSYDDAGRIVDQTDTFGAEQKLTYDEDGNVTEHDIAKGALADNTVYTTKYEYNDADQLTETKDPLNVSDSSDGIYTFAYDKVGDLIATQYPNSTYSIDEYSPDGWATAVCNEEGTIPSTPPTNGTCPSGASKIAELTYSYNLDGTVASVTRADNSADALDLSALGWRDDTGLATPGSGQTQIGYGEGGSGSGFAVTQVSSQPGGPVSDSWAWTDPADASAEITSPILSANLTSAPSIGSHATYSGTSSSSSAVWSQTVSSGTNRYLYVAITTNANSTGSVTGVTYDGTAMTPIFDGLDQDTSAGTHRDLSVWGLVAPTVATANVDATLSSSYSAVSAVSVSLTNVNQTTPKGTSLTANGGASGAQALSTTTTEGSATNYTQSYSYDSNGRLDQVTGGLQTGVGCRQYTYDADSNRTAIEQSSSTSCTSMSTTATYTYNASNPDSPGTDELTSAGSTDYTYDNAGRLTQDGNNTICWNDHNQLTRYSSGSGSTCISSTSNLITYTYGPQSDLTQRDSTQTPTATCYLLADLLETDCAGNITTSYDTGPAGNLAAFTGPPATTSTTTYLYYDAHGNLTAEQTNTATNQHTYDPYGAPIDTNTLPTNTTTHRYVGAQTKQYDTATGLILMGARPYDPTTGRFIAIDPIDGGSLNNYDYAGQDPINGYDFNGTCVDGLNWACEAAQSAWHGLQGAWKWVGHQWNGGARTTVQVSVYFTPYAVSRMESHGISEEEVVQTLQNAQGRYSGIKYVENGRDQLGFWHQGTFVATVEDAQGDPVIVNAFRAGKSYADRLLGR